MIGYIQWVLLAICVAMVVLPLFSSQADKDRKN